MESERCDDCETLEMLAAIIGALYEAGQLTQGRVERTSETGIDVLGEEIGDKNETGRRR